MLIEKVVKMPISECTPSVSVKVKVAAEFIRMEFQQ